MQPGVPCICIHIILKKGEEEIQNTYTCTHKTVCPSSAHNYTKLLFTEEVKSADGWQNVRLVEGINCTLLNLLIVAGL